MTGIEVALLVAGTAISAYSAYEGGQARKEASQYQAAVARNNQILADQNAALEIAKGQRDEVNKRIETSQRMGAVKAAAAASGLAVDEGSPLRLQEDTAVLGEFDALTIRSNAARSARGFKTQSQNFGLQSQMDLAAGRNAETAGMLGAASSIIGGASSVSGKWSSWQKDNPGQSWWGN